jgi:hypothetical protein
VGTGSGDGDSSRVDKASDRMLVAGVRTGHMPSHVNVNISLLVCGTSLTYNF